MPFDINILKEKLEGIKTAFQNGKFGDALIGALNTGNGLMQQRIFQQNQDVEGNNFGIYIGKRQKYAYKKSKNKTQDKRNKAIVGQDLTTYMRKRALAGRQVAHKDLEFWGSLRRAIETQVESETAAVLQFNNDDAALIARGQEMQIRKIRETGTGRIPKGGLPKTNIFKLNTTEKEQVNEQGLELIKQILKPK